MYPCEPEVGLGQIRVRVMRFRMDWRTVTFDWNRARAFLVTAEEGSFTAAARALQLSQPTVGRQVSALEDELGVTLFERVGNELQLTSAGMDLIEHVREMGQAATRVSLTATGQAGSLDGLVSLTASDTIAARVLPPILARLREDHPGIDLEIVATHEVSDLLRREADIAVRNARPEHAELVGRRVRDSVAGLYATPAYVERLRGEDGELDASRATFFSWDRSELLLQAYTHAGLDLGMANFGLISASHLTQWAMAREHMGVCAMMTQVGDADADMVRVFPQVEITVPVWVVAHREVRTSRRIRVVFDALVEGLS